MKVVFAFPGNTFSGLFLKQWSETMLHLIKADHQFVIANAYSSFVPFSRMKTLGLDVLRGASQVPFDGQLDYDVWFTIDSDIVFTPNQVLQLIEDTKIHPVVSGLYKMADLRHFACIKKWDTEFFKQNGTFQFMTDVDLPEEDPYMKVAYNGMGFFACRKGVIENLKYPYFSYPLIEIKSDDGKLLRDMCSEDVAFCKNLKDAGYKITVNTSIIVGHEKTLVI